MAKFRARLFTVAVRILNEHPHDSARCARSRSFSSKPQSDRLLAYVIHELGEGPAEPKRTQLVEVVRSLLEAGANPTGGSDRHQTPLGLALEYGMEDVKALLAEYIQG